MAVDCDTGEVWFGIDITSGTYGSNGLTGDPAGGTNDATLNLCQLMWMNGLLKLPQATGSSTNFMSFNAGQQPLPNQYTPPAGFEALQTANLPVAPIPNGRDHFQAITGPGNGAAAGQANAIVGNWSQQLYSSPGPATGPDDPDSTVWTPISDTDSMRFTSFAFDGNTSTACRPFGYGSLGWIIFRPDTPIDISAGDLVVTGNRLGEIFLNGTDTGAALNSATTGNVTVPKGGASQLESLWLRGSTVIGSQAQLAQITVNGDPLLDLSILNQAKATFPNGLWWIKDMVNANLHQLVSNVTNTQNPVWSMPSRPTPWQNYLPPTGDSVAWCWNAP